MDSVFIGSSLIRSSLCKDSVLWPTPKIGLSKVLGLIMFYDVILSKHKLGNFWHIISIFGNHHKNNLPPTNTCTWTKVSHFVTCLNQLHGHWSLIYFDIALLHSFDNLELVLPPVSDTHTNDDIWRRDQWWSRSMVHVVHGAVPGQATPGMLRLPAYSSMLDI